MRRIVSDIKEMRSLLADGRAVENETASWEIATSARRFARRTRAVVDDKLSLSATLMRAGEVVEAKRMLAEVEQDVLTEEAALLERVNEVRLARAVRRDRMTRLRLARSLAVALIGSGLLSFSAIGLSLAAMLQAKADPVAVSEHGANTRARRSAPERKFGSADVRRPVRLAGVKVALTERELEVYRTLTTGTVDEDGLESFLFSVLPPALAEQVHAALLGTTAKVTKAQQLVERVFPKTKKDTAQQAEADEAPGDKPASEESQQSEKNDEESQSGSDSGDGKDEEEEEPGNAPIPTPPAHL